MWVRPQAVSVVAGRGEGLTELTAFDRALMDAGIANMNFLRVSSILPAGVTVIPVPRFPPGILAPAVYARRTSHTPGERIAAAVGLGFSRDSYGVIMEFQHSGTAENAEAVVRRMVEEAMAVRDLPVDDIRVASAEHVVQRIGCVVAAVVFWPSANGLTP
ncbi:MAG: arginine decarboxylase, pyruvoyl-dependent [Armatimonadota bacterium]|nr:arginine decarboxylase, pyruvoyl-dependent [Armatimonadota bacterium]MDR7402451.1 arginine decarboxylase, pyruvoyl-dependent [Armatimonadota bacterium]MDR7403774.1 arginine decarboxylase, pyruvoyl-dependent [Armatimonadota bacterium]MDR7437897.1 arginine decarboxylase, pyruvoyl-dependent [Armatimonadota bacterium]MDR7472122.1 arginine decarboxylase, pyruvoyl-dependent [Armatimonadota bacterium]